MRQLHPKLYIGLLVDLAEFTLVSLISMEPTLTDLNIFADMYNLVDDYK